MHSHRLSPKPACWAGRHGHCLWCGKGRCLWRRRRQSWEGEPVIEAAVWLGQPEKGSFSPYLCVGPKGASCSGTNLWKLPRETGQNILILEFKFNWVLHGMFNIRLLEVASIRSSDIKHRNEHSLFLCQFKSFTIFKNILIYSQEGSLQFLLMSHLVSLEIVYKGRNGFVAEESHRQKHCPGNLLNSLPKLVDTVRTYVSKGSSGWAWRRGLLTLLFTIPLKPTLLQASTIQLYIATW